jgi:hypothetical protein
VVAQAVESPIRAAQLCRASEAANVPLKAWRADQVALGAGEPAARADLLEADEAQRLRGGHSIRKGRSNSDEHAKAGPALRRRRQVTCRRRGGGQHAHAEHVCELEGQLVHRELECLALGCKLQQRHAHSRRGRCSGAAELVEESANCA